MNHESLYLGIDPALVNVFIIFAPFSRLNVPLQDAPALTGRALAGGPIVTVNAESGVKGERDSRIISFQIRCSLNQCNFVTKFQSASSPRRIFWAVA